MNEFNEGIDEIADDVTDRLDETKEILEDAWDEAISEMHERGMMDTRSEIESLWESHWDEHDRVRQESLEDKLDDNDNNTNYHGDLP